MRLIVGLGNPGRKYQGTRHNIGFDVVDEVARRQGGSRRKSKFDGDIAEVEFGGERSLLLWPQTFMNLSGTSVGKAFEYYQLAFDELLVICDDFNLPLAKLRFRARGSSGGQKGLQDIVRRLGTEEFGRLRIGVGPLPDRWDPADFVLSRFRGDEGVEIELVVQRAADAVAAWVGRGIEDCMNEYN